MNIQLLGINKTAPVQIRALFAFTDENKKELMTRIFTQKEIRECVTAFNLQSDRLYTVSEEKISVRSNDCNAADPARYGGNRRCSQVLGAFAVLSGNTGSTAFFFMWQQAWILWFTVRIRF